MTETATLLTPNEALHNRYLAEIAIQQAESARNEAIQQVAQSMKPYVGRMVLVAGRVSTGIHIFEDGRYMKGRSGLGDDNFVNLPNNKLLVAEAWGIIIAKQVGDTEVTLGNLHYDSGGQVLSGAADGYLLFLGNIRRLEHVTE